LKEPNKIINVNVPLTVNNEIKLFSGYRVQHNNILGPYKGGLRFNQKVDLDECKALSGWMTYKTAIHDLELGGGKGGIAINPFDYSDSEKETLCRNFIKLIHQDIGEGKDIPAPDVGTTPQMMEWMNDEMIQLTGKESNFTGKPVENKGCEGRTEATGYGCVEVLKYWANKNKFSLKGSTYILQGFGNVGIYSAKYLDILGAKLIAVGDHSCYIKNNNGFDVPKLIDYVSNNKEIKGFQNDESDINEFWKTKCDIVIPAALELQIDETIAKNIQCKVILEAANGPLYFESDEILENRQIDVLPDILTNSGGVIVSYYEYLQNINKKYPEEYLSKEETLNKLSNQLGLTFNKVHDLKLDKNTSYRNCAYGLALINLEKKFTI
jgi:glutamate dehydrogenase/leucine dehydrogenase